MQAHVDVTYIMSGVNHRVEVFITAMLYLETPPITSSISYCVGSRRSHLLPVNMSFANALS